MNTKPLTHHIALSAQKAPALRWDGKTVFSQWRENCYEKLSELLGMNEFVPCEPVFRIESDETLNSNRYIHFLIQTEEGYFAHCHLLLPMDQDGPLPLCCCLQGHSTGAHISLGLAKYPGDENTIRGGDRDFAVRAVK